MVQDIITELRPEFVITIHAEQRMAERLHCSKQKMLKLAIKAWNTKKSNQDRINRVGSHHRYDDLLKDKHYLRYHELMGYVFVFSLRARPGLKPQKVLVTVIG